MWNKDVTWGDLRAYHEEKRTQGGGKGDPNDLLNNPKVYELSLSKEDHEYVYDPTEEELQTLKEIRDLNNIEAKPGIVSVTVSRTGEILELIKVTDEDGNMYVRDQRLWARVSPDSEEPRIHDQTLQDVEERFVEYWDRLKEKGATITKDIVQHYAV